MDAASFWRDLIRYALSTATLFTSPKRAGGCIAVAVKKDLPAWFDADLDWYVNEYDGAMGLRALPAEPMPRACYYDDPLSSAADIRSQAAARGRRIAHALEGLRTGWRTLLMAAHLRIPKQRHVDIHAAHEAMIKESRTDLMEATAAFRRRMKR